MASTTKKLLTRGRPKTATVLEAILNNENHHDSDSSQEKFRYNGWKKCEICHRYFPRKKSLKEHVKIHTGVKPYACTYPGCKRKFTQSGHLKLHTKLHTGEKPFACPVPGCTTRYVHPNRKCRKHLQEKVRRDGLERISYPEHPTAAERLWFQDYEAKLAISVKRPVSLRQQRKGSASYSSESGSSTPQSSSESDSTTPQSSSSGSPGREQIYNTPSEIMECAVAMLMLGSH